MAQGLLGEDLNVLDVKGQLLPDIAVDGDFPGHVFGLRHDNGLE